jgi:hypothetical protein
MSRSPSSCDASPEMAHVRNHAKLAIDGPVHETWTLGYLIDTIDLTGPAGATYAHRADHSHTEHLSLDAVDFCRTLAGRGHPVGLLTTIVPF